MLDVVVSDSGDVHETSDLMYGLCQLGVDLYSCFTSRVSVQRECAAMAEHLAVSINRLKKQH